MYLHSKTIKKPKYELPILVFNQSSLTQFLKKINYLTVTCHQTHVIEQNWHFFLFNIETLTIGRKFHSEFKSSTTYTDRIEYYTPNIKYFASPFQSWSPIESVFSRKIRSSYTHSASAYNYYNYLQYTNLWCTYFKQGTKCYYTSLIKQSITSRRSRYTILCKKLTQF